MKKQANDTKNECMSAHTHAYTFLRRFKIVTINMRDKRLPNKQAWARVVTVVVNRVLVAAW